MGNGSSFNSFPPSGGPPRGGGNYFNLPPTSDDSTVSEGLRMPRPGYLPNGAPDESASYAYWRSTNLCWIFAIILAVVLMAILGGVFDAGLLVSWTSHGSKRLNDRSVPVSSLHSKNFDLSDPSFVTEWPTNSTTTTAAVWDGVVFFCSWDGRITGIHEHTGETLWIKKICEDYYDVDADDCPGLVLSQEYICVATPTAWGPNMVVSVRKPPGFVVINQKTGELVKKATLTTNEHAIVTQSGTVWDDSYIVGTSISEEEAWEDADDGCTFIGELFRWNLDANALVWKTSMEDPYGTHPDEPSGFSGMPIRGSSPALSVKKGLIAVTVGNLVCRPSWYAECVAASPCNDEDDDEEEFDPEAYRTRYDECHNHGTAKFALFNSVVLIKFSDGSLYWHEKLLGHRAWSAACFSLGLPHPCVETLGDDDAACDFYHNPLLNCPSEEESCENSFEFAGDPTLQVHSGGQESLYVQQHSGEIYAFDLRNDDSEEEHEPAVSLPSGYDFSRLRWARSPFPGAEFSGTGGGIAVDKRGVFFSIYNRNERPWIYGPDNVTTYCGGWGALETSNGLPIWYKPNPMCNFTFVGCDGDPELPASRTGGRGPPAITNDLVLVTSEDTTRRPDGEFQSDWNPSDNYCGGHVFALHKKNGNVVTSYETKEPFTAQGFSLHGRCAYVGNGPDPSKLKAVGKKMFGWCVPQAWNSLEDSSDDEEILI